MTKIDNFGLALQNACTCLCETLCIREERMATNLKKYEAENVSIIPQPSEHNGENNICIIGLPMNFSNAGEMMVLPINEVVNMFQNVARMYTDSIKYVLINKSPVYSFERNLKRCEKNINNSLRQALLSVNELHKIYLLYKQPLTMNEVNYVLFKKTWES
ncbi:hypothetical protein THOM_2582 [Trachipleistophora hominis]|uniref:Uncharacterized protein n=1 Tax=Trachipleistophora hominis TaxID=72359 RepID=L7JUP1_TRAHO|nr:hypothetical protein THOM_2582 [Trachipleistophora hominis]